MNKKKILQANNFHELHKQVNTFILPNAWDE